MAKSMLKTKQNLMILLIGFTAVLCLLIIRLFYIQVIDSQRLQKMAYDQQTRDRLITSKRGTIYSSDGKKLAVSASVETVSVVPSQVKDKEKVAIKLAEILELDVEKVRKQVNSKSSLVTIKKKVEKETTDKIREWILAEDIDGIKMDETTKRFYPNNNLASHVLGFTGEDNQGLYGIEKSYEKILTGLPGRVVAETDGKGNEIPYESEKYYSPQNGSDIVLSIDSSIQYFAEKYLEEAVINNKCEKGGIAIVTRPATGDILAMAVKNDFNPNEPFGPYTEEQAAVWDTMTSDEKVIVREKQWRNRAISDTYEPGSTFKLITASVGLDTGLLTPEETFTCKGSYTVAGVTMKCWRYYRPHGAQNFIQAMENSCNPVFIEIGQRFGKERMYKYIEGFGFKDKTGIELPGETAGIFHHIQNVGPVELATISFGQRFQVTALQMAQAASAIANDGKLMKPRIVKEIKDINGNVLETIEPKPIRQVISKQTSETIRGIMKSVVSEGTGKNAYVKGFNVGGKSGTAEQGTGASTWYVASFIGIAPADNPEICVLVSLFDPKGESHQGGTVAAPVVGKIINDTVKYLQLPPEYDPNDPEAVGVTVPDLRGKNVGEARNILQKLGLRVNIKGNESNPIIDQTPKANIEVFKNSTVILYTEENIEKDMVEVPNIIGRSINDATNMLKAVGLNIQSVGLGNAKTQNIAPGTQVERGSVIEVTFVVEGVE